MAITEQTQRIHHEITIHTNSMADASTRTLTARWATAWRELQAEWENALEYIVTLQARGETPHPGDIAQVDRINRALKHTADTLTDLADGIPGVIDGPLAQAVEETARLTREVIASQLPAGIAVGFGIASAPALNHIIKRSLTQIHAASWPLTDDAISAIKTTLIRAVPSGWHPDRAAEEMLARTRTAFNGGLTRAMTIARTEILDAHRAAAATTADANADIITGWVWSANLDKDTCPACLAKHGTLHAIDEPGPEGHPNCRCARIDKLKTWKDLGIDLPEPPDLIEDSQEWVDAHPSVARRILGPTRYQMLTDGDITISDLATKKTSPGWRDSWHPTTVRDLEKKAGK